MNCKPGDLAVIVRADNPSNLGRIVRCVRLADDTGGTYGPSGEFAGNQCWWIDASIVSFDKNAVVRICPDYFLRPIRDNDGTDETLTWASKPQGVAA